MALVLTWEVVPVVAEDEGAARLSDPIEPADPDRNEFSLRAD